MVYRSVVADPGARAVVGLDVGATSINASVVDGTGRFLVDRLVGRQPGARRPRRGGRALAGAMEHVLALTGTPVRGHRRRPGHPGPASADGVISSRGSTNFSQPAWRGFDFRGALEDRLGIPVVYNNDGNAAAFYAHHVHFGPDARDRSSVSAIVGTGLGGGVIETGRVVPGAAGMAGFGHHVRWATCSATASRQVCNCEPVRRGGVASLTGIEKNLLPYWLDRFRSTAWHPPPRSANRRWSGRSVARRRWR
jgi:predicted NBD/HSP70 family sugar kinase